MKSFVQCLSVATATLAAFSSQGSLLFSDRFNYPDGPITELPGSPWQSHGGSPRQVEVQSGAVLLTQLESEDVNAPLNEAPHINKNLYASFTIALTAPPRGDGGFFLHFKDAGSGQQAKVFASTNQCPPGSFKVGIAHSTGTPQYVNEFLPLVGSHRIVIRCINSMQGASTLWLAPESESSASKRAEASDAGAVLQLQAIALRQSLSSGDGMGVLEIDDLLVSDTFEDVAGANTPPSISSMIDVDMGANEVTAILPFIVEDQETPAEEILVTFHSSNPGLISPKGASFHGSGRNRGIRMSAVAGMQGSSVITLEATDGVKTAQTTFTVLVGAPYIEGPRETDIPASGQSALLEYRISDRESLVDSLTVRAESLNTNILRDDGIVWAGTADRRQLTLIPTSGASGMSDVRVIVSDGVMERAQMLRATVHPSLPLLFEDGFVQPDGGLVPGPASWLVHAPADGSISNVLVQSDRLLLSGSRAEDISVRLPGSPYRSGMAAILHAGIRFRLTALPSAAGNFFAHFRDDHNGFRCRLHVANPGGAGSSYYLGISSGSEPPLYFHGALQLGEFHTAVVQYRTGSRESRLWLNPSSPEDTHLKAAAEATLGVVSHWSFRQAYSIGAVEVDSIRVAGGFMAVLDPRIAPELSIARQGGVIRLSWAYTRGLVLESSPALMPGTWSLLAREVETDGSTQWLDLPLDSTREFFRFRP
ncbi:MAG: hypothetical protein FJ405_01035 [Verrucomicrobia bacterium]|nr:hypothetical protein [Verrucomicrobiota bacterium]